MKASELISLVKSVKIDDRSDLIAGPSDELAEPAILARLITQAQLEYCRYTGALISNGPTDVLDTLPLVANQRAYLYSPSFVSISAVRLGDSNQALALVSTAQFETVTQNLLPGGGWVPTETANNLSGRPVAYSLDAAVGRITLNAPPSAEVVASAVSLHLRGLRYPVTDVTTDTLDQELSIPPEAHYGLADWVAAELLSTPNAERQQQRVAEQYRTNFRMFLREHRALAIQRANSRPTFRFNSFGPR